LPAKKDRFTILNDRNDKTAKAGFHEHGRLVIKYFTKFDDMRASIYKILQDHYHAESHELHTGFINVLRRGKSVFTFSATCVNDWERVRSFSHLLAHLTYFMSAAVSEYPNIKLYLHGPLLGHTDGV